MTSRILLDEKISSRLPEDKKHIFIYNWLRSLPQILISCEKSFIKEHQEDLVQQLISQLANTHGNSIHRAIGHCLSILFTIGDSFLAYTAINACNSLLKSKDEGTHSISSRSAALNCLAIIYKHLGKAFGHSFEDTVPFITRLIKQSESPIRYESLNALQTLLIGLGTSTNACRKDILKVSKSCMTDRVMIVRCAAAKVLRFHSCMNLCVSLGNRMNLVVPISAPGVDEELKTNNAASTTPVLDEALAFLDVGFLRGPGGFLKTSNASDIIKGVNSVNREVRIGITYAYTEFLIKMGPSWLNANLPTITNHLIGLLTNNRATPTHTEALYSKRCIGFILSTISTRLLSDSMLKALTSQLISALRHQLADSISVNDLSSSDRPIADSSTRQSDLTEKSGSSNSRALFRNQRESMHQQQHVLVFILDQITLLIQQLGSCIVSLCDPPVNLDQFLCTSNLLSHPLPSVRLACAACLRQLTMVVPDLRSPMSAQCLTYLRRASSTSSADQMLGYAAAIAGIVAGSSLDLLGLPLCQLDEVFQLGDNLLRAANQNSRITLQRTQAAWILLASSASTGIISTQPRMLRMIQFWRSVFPRNATDAEAEKQRGDAFTWQVMLESRTGALCSIQSFLEHCSSQDLSEEIVTSILAVLDSASTMLIHLPDIVRSYGNHLKTTAAMLRFRLYSIVLLLSCATHSGTQTILLRELIADCTLVDNAANTTTSLLGRVCSDEAWIGFSSHCKPEHWLLEQQLQPYGYNTLGASEHDSAYLFSRDGLRNCMPVYSDDQVLIKPGEGSSNLGGVRSRLPSHSNYSISHIDTATNGPSFCGDRMNQGSHPTRYSRLTVIDRSRGFDPDLLPPPIGVAVIDAAIKLFAHLLPSVTERHRLQMLQHFTECIQLAKSSRQEALQVNILTALLLAVRNLANKKTLFGEEPEVRQVATSLALNCLTNTSNTLLRLASGEYLGRLVQVVGQPCFLIEISQHCIDRLRTNRNPIARAGHCLAVGCLHRHAGILTSGHILNTSIGLLLSIAQDSGQQVAQLWALFALTLIADTGGPLFREFVEPVVGLVIQLMLRSQDSALELRRSLGYLLNALLVALGPELQSSSEAMSITRNNCLLTCLIMQDSTDACLRAQALVCLQKLNIFAPQHTSLLPVVPKLRMSLSNPHCWQMIRRSALASLYQLSQLNPVELTTWSARHAEIAATSDPMVDLLPNWLFSQTDNQSPSNSLLFDLFNLINSETDMTLIGDAQETLINILLATGHLHLGEWLKTLKNILQVYTEQTRSDARPDFNRQIEVTDAISDQNSIPFCEESESNLCPNATDNRLVESLQLRIPPRWFCQLLAINFLRYLIRKHFQLNKELPDKFGKHFDLSAARLARSGIVTLDYLVDHLGDLVRIAFRAIVDTDSRHLQMTGLLLMHDVIECFAHVPDPDDPGHLLLEQFHLQISSAIRSTLSISFDTLSPSSQPTTHRSDPIVTSLAFQCASSWLSSAVSSDLHALNRVYNALKSGLDDLSSSPDNLLDECHSSSQSSGCSLYSKDAYCFELLSLLRAWADIYCAVNQIETKQAIDGAQQPTDTYLNNMTLVGRLVRPHIHILGRQWLTCLRDYALLTGRLTDPNPTNESGGALLPSSLTASYIEHCPIWLAALSHWSVATDLQSQPDIHNCSTFTFLIGICINALCNIVPANCPVLNLYADSLFNLLQSPVARQLVVEESVVIDELLQVMHRTIIFQDSVDFLLLEIRLIKTLLLAIEEAAIKDCSDLLSHENDLDEVTTTTVSASDQCITAKYLTKQYGTSLIRQFLVLLATLLERVESILSNNSTSDLLRTTTRNYPAIIPSIACDCLQILTNIAKKLNTDLKREQVTQSDASKSMIDPDWNNSLLAGFLQLTLRISLLITQSTRSSDESVCPTQSECQLDDHFEEADNAITSTTTRDNAIKRNKVNVSLAKTDHILIESALLNDGYNSTLDRVIVQLSSLVNYHCLNNSQGTFTDDPLDVEQRSEHLVEWSSFVIEAIRGLISATGQKNTPFNLNSQSLGPAILVLVSKLLSHLPSSLLLLTNTGQALLSDVLQLANRCWQESQLDEARLNFLTAVNHFISHPDQTIGAFFVKALTPRVFRWLCDSANTSRASRENAYNRLAIDASLNTLQSLINMTKPSKRQAIILVTLPLMCNLLQPTTIKFNDLPEHDRHTHRSVVQKVIEIASCYPVDFKLVCGVMGDLRYRLENALRDHQSTDQDGDPATSTTASTVKGIELRTDFGSFVN